MALLPKVKLKALVSFPATILDGTGVDVIKANGTYRFDLDYSDFAPPVGGVGDATHSNVLLWNDVTGTYSLVPLSVLASGGTLPEAPNDGIQYGRQSLAWTPVISGGVAPATAIPLADGVAAVGVSLKYAREDHVHPAGAVGSGDVTGPASSVADRIAVYDGTSGKIIKDGGKTIAEILASGGGGASVTTSDTPPPTPADGDLWWQSDTGVLFVYYQDINSSAWVSAVPAVSENSAVTVNPNVIINGDFRINQGGYVSAAVLAAAAYGHDQWKAGASGGDYSFTQLKSSTQITIASGKSLIQPIEDINVVGGSYVLSWTGTAQARAGVNTLTPAGAYAASPLLITGQTAGTVMSVEFNAGTLGTVKLESGSLVTPFVMRPADEELLRCFRYWEKLLNACAGSFPGAGNYSHALWTFKVRKRITPAMAFASGTVGVVFETSVDGSDISALSANAHIVAGSIANARL